MKLTEICNDKNTVVAPVYQLVLVGGDGGEHGLGEHEGDDGVRAHVEVTESVGR